jgi:hypothetical protein
MADVRLEYSKAVLSYELIEAILGRDFSRTQLCILLALIRQTDGMRRRTGRLSVSSLACYAGMRAVSGLQRPSGSFRQSLRELVVAGVVLEPERGIFAIEPDAALWRELRGRTKSDPGLRQRAAS